MHAAVVEAYNGETVLFALEFLSTQVVAVHYARDIHTRFCAFYTSGQTNNSYSFQGDSAW